MGLVSPRIIAYSVDPNGITLQLDDGCTPPTRKTLHLSAGVIWVIRQQGPATYDGKPLTFPKEA